MNNSIPMRTRPFQSKLMHANWSNHSKVMAEKRFKNDFCVCPVKSIKHAITIFGVRTKVIYTKNISKIRDITSIFPWFIAKTNIRMDRQINFKLSDGNNTNNETTEKTKLFHPKKIWKSEQSNKNYVWQSNKKIWINLSSNCVTFPSFKSVKNKNKENPGWPLPSFSNIV